jgi:hypothetical protein
LREKLAGRASPLAARSRMDLAVLLATTGRPGEARALLDEALRRLEDRFGAEAPCLADPLENSARLALMSGDRGRAVTEWRRLQVIVERHQLPTHQLATLTQVMSAAGADPAASPHVLEESPPSLADTRLDPDPSAPGRPARDDMAFDLLTPPEATAGMLDGELLQAEPPDPAPRIADAEPVDLTSPEVVLRDPPIEGFHQPDPLGIDLAALDWGMADPLTVSWGALDTGALVLDAEVPAQPGHPLPDPLADVPDGALTEWTADAASRRLPYADAADEGQSPAFPVEPETDVLPHAWEEAPVPAGQAGAAPAPFPVDGEVEVPWDDDPPVARGATSSGGLLQVREPEIPDFLFPGASDGSPSFAADSEALGAPPMGGSGPSAPTSQDAAPWEGAAWESAPVGANRAPVFTTHSGEAPLEQIAPELAAEAAWGRTGAATPHDGNVAVNQSPMTKYEEIVRRASRQPSLNRGRRRRAPMTTGRVVLLSAITVAVVGAGGASWWLLLR